ncbi:MAG: SRPBCC family protein [Bradymonadia bacterium]
MSEMIIHTTVDINASAETAWAIFGEGFGEWADWAPGIDASALEGPLTKGCVRVNQTPSLGTVRQKLTRFDRGQQALTYEMSETLPPMFTHMRNDWEIEPLDATRCRLVGKALFVLSEKSAPMRNALEGKMGSVLEGFSVAFRDHVHHSEQA